MPSRKVSKAIIPAAGLGTRFLPATKASPKEMLPLVDKPLIQYAVEEAVSAGIQDIIIITGRGKRAIEDHFDVSFEWRRTLKEAEKRSCSTRSAGFRSWQIFVMSASGTPGVWGTRSSAPNTSSGTNRSQ